MKNTKGLSTIVATLLIILLTLVAVAIIWVVVKNVIKTGAEEVSIGKFSISLEISRVEIANSTGINITVKRNPGEANLAGIVFITYSSDTSESFKSYFVLQPLQEKEFGIVLSSFNSASARKIAIAPILISDSGKEFIGEIQDEYVFPEPILFVCGDGIIESPYEACDDGDNDNGDGCSQDCDVETGWVCNGQPSVCVFGGSGGVDYTWTNELLTNTGFESGSLVGWESSANFYVTTDSPQAGTYASFSQDVSNVNYFIRQEVNLATWASYIDSNDAVINATGYGKSMQFPGHDRTLIEVIFFNSAHAVISSETSGYVEDGNWWEGGVKEYPIPVGTRYVQVFANSYDPDASSSGSLDSFSVRVGYEN